MSLGHFFEQHFCSRVSAFGIPSLCFYHCNWSPGHSFYQPLTTHNFYLAPFHFNPLPGSLNSFWWCFVAIEDFQDMFHRMNTWRLYWWIKGPDVLRDKSILGSSRIVFGVIMLSKDNALLRNSRILNTRKQIIPQNEGIQLSIHPSLHLYKYLHPITTHTSPNHRRTSSKFHYSIYFCLLSRLSHHFLHIHASTWLNSVNTGLI